MTLVILVLMLRLRAAVLPERPSLPVPEVNEEETARLYLSRRRIFRAPRL